MMSVLSHSASAQTWITNPANGHHYAQLDSYQSWLDCEAKALGLRGHLVTINDAAENDWVRSSFNIYGGLNTWCWIGLREDQPYNSTTRTWSWSSTEQVTYTNWAPGEPSSPAEHYVAMDGDGMWRDLSSSWGQPYFHTAVVEVVPEPSSMLVPALGLLAMLFLRRHK